MASIPLTVHWQPKEDGVPLPLHEQDPLELVGMVIAGDESQMEAMATALIEEFIFLGWHEKQLLAMFSSPSYVGTHRIYEQMGEAWVRRLIESLCARWRIER